MTSIGRQVAVGSPGGTAKLLCAFWLGTTIRWGVWNFGGNNWTGIQLPGAYTGVDSNLVPRALTSDLWFIFSFRGNSTEDGRTAYTRDAGASWNPYPIPEGEALPAEGRYNWQDIAKAVDGRLWGLTFRDPGVFFQQDIKIWFSDNDGDSWTESHAANLSQQEIYYIAVHPTDPDIIAAWGYRPAGDASITYITKDRGATWTQHVVENTVEYSFGEGHETEILILASGRLVVATHENSTFNAGIMVSDDDGASWTFKVTFDTRANGHRVSGPVSNPSGSRLFALHVIQTISEKHATVIESTDQGDTWVTYDSEVPFHFVPSGQGYGGIAYNAIENSIYVGNSNPSGDGLRIIMKLSPAIANGGIWADVSLSLQDLDPFAFRFDQPFGTRIAIIP